jgi:hypothetical protein
VVCGRGDSRGNGFGSQQRQRRGHAMMVEAEAAQGQTTINYEAVAIAGETVVVAETAAAVAVAAAAAMVAAMRQPWQWWRRCQLCLAEESVIFPALLGRLTPNWHHCRGGRAAAAVGMSWCCQSACGLVAAGREGSSHGGGGYAVVLSGQRCFNARMVELSGR